MSRNAVRLQSSSTNVDAMHPPSSAHREWFDQLGGENSPLAESILDRIVHDAYRVKLEVIDPEQDISMREIYGLKDEY